MMIQSGCKYVTVGIVLCSLHAQATETVKSPYLGSKTSYPTPPTTLQYPSPPPGYQLVYSEIVARHGARTIDKPTTDHLLAQIWQTAKQEKGLTAVGEALGPQIQAWIAANEQIGYGELTQQGKDEERQLGERFAQQHEVLLSLAMNEGRTISVWHSGQSRAKASAAEFVTGLLQTQLALQASLEAPQADPDRLYFPKAAQNEPYRDYVKHNHLLKNTLHEIIDQPDSHKAAMNVLKPLFTPSFIHGLEGHAYHFKLKSKTVSPDELDTARLLYEAYSVTASMQHEGQWSFNQWMPKASAEWFAYLEDAEAFYEKGPGFKGNDITYRMAKPLLQDFFAGVTQLSREAKPEVARLRFTHAEVIAPLATLLQVEGTEKQAIGSPLFLYHYRHNPWRSEKIIPYAANIQWDVYRDSQQHYLVRMLYNEHPIHFKATCKPMTPNSVFYDLDSLKQCYQSVL